MYILQRLALFAIGLIGLPVSLFSYTGILAARVSIGRAREEWRQKNLLWRLHPAHVPQPFGQGSTFEGGTRFAERIPKLFAWMWCLYLSGYLLLTYLMDVHPCLSSSQSLACLRGDNASEAWLKGIWKAWASLWEFSNVLMP